MTRVDITTAGHTIIIDSADDLDTVANKALSLWTATRDPTRGLGFSQHLGAVTERASVPSYTAHPEVDLTTQEVRRA